MKWLERMEIIIVGIILGLIIHLQFMDRVPKNTLSGCTLNAEEVTTNETRKIIQTWECPVKEPLPK